MDNPLNCNIYDINDLVKAINFRRSFKIESKAVILTYGEFSLAQSMYIALLARDLDDIYLYGRRILIKV